MKYLRAYIYAFICQLITLAALYFVYCLIFYDSPIDKYLIYVAAFGSLGGPLNLWIDQRNKK